MSFPRPMAKVEHLYIHLPFCSRRCDYCDFFSETGSAALAGPYVDTLLDELDEFGEFGYPIKTVYLGGGTPTLIGVDLLVNLLNGVAARGGAATEVTVEANPSTVTAELAEKLRKAGVTRISLGAQSFLPRIRENLGRSGQAEDVERAVSLLRQTGLENIGIDMIFGIPGQSLDDLGRDIEAVLTLEPEHISWYELTVKEGSRYQARWAEELGAMESAGMGRTFYESIVDSLEAAGYRWYETSNYARPGYECRHNVAYWQGSDYLGLGAGAWSTVGMRRWRNVEDTGLYLEAAGTGDWDTARTVEVLSREEKTREKLMLGLRLDSGVSAALVEAAIDSDQLKFLQQSGFLSIEGGRISLTRAGRFVANEVCARLLTP